jgi:hypothetical protein
MLADKAKHVPEKCGHRNYNPPREETLRRDVSPRPELKSWETVYQFLIGIKHSNVEDLTT